MLDPSFQPRTITLPKPEGAGERPVAALTLDARVEQSLDELAQALGETEFTDWLMTSLRAAYRPGTAWPTRSRAGSRRCSARTAWSSSTRPTRRPSRSSPTSSRASSAPPGARRRSRTAAGDALAARGHQPQVVPQPDSVALFHLDGARRPIRRQGDQFVVGDSTFTVDALTAARRAQSPDAFSPNVLLRPLVQDTLFPTICYVAGPSELAYLGQLRGVYEQLRHPDAADRTRAPRATLVDSATARFLARYDVPLEDLQPQDESALNRLLESQLPPSVEQAIKDAEDALRANDGAASSRRCRPSIRRSPARRRRRSARWSTTCGRCRAR